MSRVLSGPLARAQAFLQMIGWGQEVAPWEQAGIEIL